MSHPLSSLAHSDVPLDLLESDVVEALVEFLARRDWALSYQLGHVLAPFAKGRYRQLGYGHYAPYCREVLGISSATARRMTRLAHGLDKYPVMRQSFEAGRLCPSKVELLLPVLKSRPEEEAGRVAQAERLSVRALREVLPRDLEHEPDLMYFSCEMTGDEVLSWRQARETARIDLEGEVPRGEILEYVVADYLSGAERLNYEEVLLPSPRREREYPLTPARKQKVKLVSPELPEDANELQQLALQLLAEQKRVALRQGDALVDLVVRYQRRGPVRQLAIERLGLERSTVYKRMALGRGVQRYPELAETSMERGLVLLELLEAGVARKEWVEFSRGVTLLELERWKEHVLWQATFRFEDFQVWVYRAPERGEKPGVQMSDSGSVQMLDDEPRRRVGWMIPRDLYPLLMEGIDLAAEGLFTPHGQSLRTMFDQFSALYQKKRKGDLRSRVRHRDEHRCQAPGCTGRGVHTHHIKFKSQTGPDIEWNMVSLCQSCHDLLHKLGTLKVYGLAPDQLVWIRPNERWVNGRRAPPDG